MGFCQGLFGFEDGKGYEYCIREGLGLVGENHLESKFIIIPGIDIEFHRDGLSSRDCHLPGNSGERLGILVFRRWIGLKHYGPCDRDFRHAGNCGVKHEFVSLVKVFRFRHGDLHRHGYHHLFPHQGVKHLGCMGINLDHECRELVRSLELELGCSIRSCP